MRAFQAMENTSFFQENWRKTRQTTESKGEYTANIPLKALPILFS
jgi:hypothetical protein